MLKPQLKSKLWKTRNCYNDNNMNTDVASILILLMYCNNSLCIKLRQMLVGYLSSNIRIGPAVNIFYYVNYAKHDMTALFVVFKISYPIWGPVPFQKKVVFLQQNPIIWCTAIFLTVVGTNLLIRYPVNNEDNVFVNMLIHYLSFYKQ